jgi:hypothetical protein
VPKTGLHKHDVWQNHEHGFGLEQEQGIARACLDPFLCKLTECLARYHSTPSKTIFLAVSPTST